MSFAFVAFFAFFIFLFSYLLGLFFFYLVCVSGCVVFSTALYFFCFVLRLVFLRRRCFISFTLSVYLQFAISLFLFLTVFYTAALIYEDNGFCGFSIYACLLINNKG